LFDSPWGVTLSKQEGKPAALRPAGHNADMYGQFDIIKACEGYLASFEATTPEEASASYLHGWRMGRLGQRRYDRSPKTDRVEQA